MVEPSMKVNTLKLVVFVPTGTIEQVPDGERREVTGRGMIQTSMEMYLPGNMNPEHIHDVVCIVDPAAAEIEIVDVVTGEAIPDMPTTYEPPVVSDFGRDLFINAVNDTLAKDHGPLGNAARKVLAGMGLKAPLR